MNPQTNQSAEGPVSLTLFDSPRFNLAEVLSEEAVLMETLISEVLRQRKGVAEQDLALVDETVHGTSRILLTLGEARRRRRTVVQVLVGHDETDLAELDVALGNHMDAEAKGAWSTLKSVAKRLSRELEANRRLLEEAISMGEDYVRTLYGATASGGGAYTANAQPASERTGGVLINRRV